MPVERVRIDKWLWAARFFKTRSAATEAVLGGHVQVNGARVKPAQRRRRRRPARDRPRQRAWTVVVPALADKRGPATVAAALYEETPESAAERRAARDERRLARPLGADLGERPTKRDRRRLDALRRGQRRAGRRRRSPPPGKSGIESMLEYEHDPRAELFGLEAAEKLGSPRSALQDRSSSTPTAAYLFAVVPVEARLRAKTLGKRAALPAPRRCAPPYGLRTGQNVGARQPQGARLSSSTSRHSSTTRSWSMAAAAGSSWSSRRTTCAVDRRNDAVAYLTL